MCICVCVWVCVNICMLSWLTLASISFLYICMLPTINFYELPNCNILGTVMGHKYFLSLQEMQFHQATWWILCRVNLYMMSLTGTHRCSISNVSLWRQYIHHSTSRCQGQPHCNKRHYGKPIVCVHGTGTHYIYVWPHLRFWLITLAFWKMLTNLPSLILNILYYICQVFGTSCISKYWLRKTNFECLRHSTSLYTHVQSRLSKT